MSACTTTFSTIFCRHLNTTDLLHVLALLIATSNGLLLYRLLKKRHKTRADKIFIILSCSDICVGLLSVPVNSLPLFMRDFDVLCIFSWVLTFFTYAP